MPELTHEDRQHLDWLRYGYYVVGGTTLLCGFFPIIHFSVGIGMLTGLMHVPDTSARFFGGAMFTLIPLVLMLMFWSLGACLIYAGRCIGQRRRKTFIAVAAVMALAFIQPFGAIIGAFTFIVFQRPQVKAAFATVSGGRPTQF